MRTNQSITTIPSRDLLFQDLLLFSRYLYCSDDSLRRGLALKSSNFLGAVAAVPFNYLFTMNLIWRIDLRNN